MMKTDELRERYLAFFETRGHRRCPSDVLVPTWDPSVLFTPAGMNQFKDHFLGKVKLEFTRATTSQKCLRTGDIENVGRTAYHHTFFEMLGNFSFGDYFKREAIEWAWEFLTSRQWLSIDPSQLSATVYEDDNEAATIWRDIIGLPDARIERLGEDENFWPASAPSQGPDGVCGPCSEIFYHPDDGEAVEIWNLVFTQFNRVGDPPDNLRPLPSRNIDTGMGLERTASVLQGTHTNFHIDILRPIVLAVAEVCDTKYEADTEAGRRIRRITDHVRACTMAIHENIYPGPNKEKYVIRRLLRRAVLDGHQLGVHEPFLFQVVPAVVQQMRTGYPDLVDTAERVAGVIKGEESAFFGTIDAGLARIGRIFDEMRTADRMTVDGGEAAELYQTYGVPPELVEAIAAEQNLAFDWTGFRGAMQQHGEASGKVVHTVMGDTGDPIAALKKAIHETISLAYETAETEVQVKGIVAQGQLCDQVTAIGHQNPLVVILDRSPFYAESGGQVGDTGKLTGDQFTFRVIDTQKDGALVLHSGHLVEGTMTAGDHVVARVDATRRDGIRRAHSATHLLHYALQENLGSHSQQQGSKVDDDWLRFDFTQLTPITSDQLLQVESDVRRQITAAEPIGWDVVPLAKARAAGAMMLFGERYPDPVRMVSMGQFSRELCGGTHLSNTAEIGPFEIVGEESIAAGTRRITALTGLKAQEHVRRTEAALEAAANCLEAEPQQVPTAACELAQRVRDLKKCLAGGGEPLERAATAKDATVPAVPAVPAASAKSLLAAAARALNIAPLDVPDRLAALRKEVTQREQQLRERAAAGPLTADELLAAAHQAHDATLVIAETPGAGAGAMRRLVDEIRKKAAPAAVLLASCEAQDKVTIVAGVSRDLVKRGGDAGQWVRAVATLLGGGGGGRPDMAQAGGKHPEQLPAALDLALKRISEMIAP
jgi:alanyl-tRNA synthetase